MWPFNKKINKHKAIELSKKMKKLVDQELYNYISIINNNEDLTHEQIDNVQKLILIIENYNELEIKNLMEYKESKLFEQLKQESFIFSKALKKLAEDFKKHDYEDAIKKFEEVSEEADKIYKEVSEFLIIN